MDERDRFIRENELVDAIADDCAASRAVIAAAEARLIRRYADAWELAQEQTSRIASADSRRRDMPLRTLASQIAVELHVNDRTLQATLHRAWVLVNDFAATVDALEAGLISKGHAEAVREAGQRLEDAEVRGAFEAVVLEWAAAETVGRTRAYAQQLAEKLDPRPMSERHLAAAADRSITLVDLGDGMSQIIARIPTLEAHGILDRLTRQATEIQRTRAAQSDDPRHDAPADPAAEPGLDVPSPDGGAPEADTDSRERAAGVVDTRTLDQLRTDLFIDMLLAGTPSIDPTDTTLIGGLGAIRARVQITMPITTLTGVTQGGAEVDGKAPIDPAAARCLAGATRVWDRVMYDPVTAVVLAVDRYRQTPAQERFLHARDRRCRFPGCRMPARRCQIDHTHEHHDGGDTDIGNLACLCVRHHTMKTETAWTARQRPDGSLQWTSPNGRTYTDRAPRVVFTPDLTGTDDAGDPAPF